MIHITGVDYEGVKDVKYVERSLTHAMGQYMSYDVEYSDSDGRNWMTFGTEWHAKAAIAVITNTKMVGKCPSAEIRLIRDSETDGKIDLFLLGATIATIDYAPGYKDILKKVSRRLGVRINYSDEVSYSKDQRKFYTKTGRLRVFDMPDSDFILDDLAIERVNELTRRESLIEELSQDLGQCPAYAEQRIRAIALQLLELAPNANRLEPGSRILEL